VKEMKDFLSMITTGKRGLYLQEAKYLSPTRCCSGGAGPVKVTTNFSLKSQRLTTPPAMTAWVDRVNQLLYEFNILLNKLKTLAYKFSRTISPL